MMFQTRTRISVSEPDNVIIPLIRSPLTSCSALDTRSAAVTRLWYFGPHVCEKVPLGPVCARASQLTVSATSSNSQTLILTIGVRLIAFLHCRFQRARQIRNGAPLRSVPTTL